MSHSEPGSARTGTAAGARVGPVRQIEVGVSFPNAGTSTLFGGYWLTIFSAGDWETYGPRALPPEDAGGVIFYAYQQNYTSTISRQWSATRPTCGTCGRPRRAFRRVSPSWPGSTRELLTLRPATGAALGRAYWLSVFTGTDARPYLRPEEADLRHEPGLVYYRAYLEQGEPPFRVDSLIPAAVEVPRPGAHPDPTASTAGGLFPSPVRVAGPGILPPPES